MKAAAIALLVAIAASGPARAAEPEPADYRGEPYRAPVPATLDGALVIDAATAYALWWSGQVGFIDVLPRPPRPANLPEDTLWRDRPHDTVPGAVWLPNTGYQTLAEPTLAYFLDGLAEATGGDTTAPIVVFCQRDCWMSWNAAKRAIEHGYTRVYWYPAGTDGWAEHGWPTERAAPYPAS